MAESGEFFYACAMAHLGLRAQLQSYLREMHYTSKLAQAVAVFFLHEDQMVRPYRPVELQGALQAYQFIDTEIFKTIAQCNAFRDNVEDERSVTQILQGFQSWYQSRRVAEVVAEHKEDPGALIHHISAIRDVNFVPIPVYRLGELDIATVLQEDMGTKEAMLPTSFDFIKEAMPQGGYMRGKLVMVCAAPGVGKSLWLAHEVLAMLKDDHKVYWLSLGDMMRLDFYIRLTAIHKGIPLRDVTMDPKFYWDEDMRNLTRNLRFSVVAPAQLDPQTARSAIEMTISQEEAIDVVVCDYDANFVNRSLRQSMYDEGEAVYNVLASLARPIDQPPRLVMVASQPKQWFWEQEEIPLEAAAESSRKQAIVDIMITMGKSPHIKPQHAGVMAIKKARRGRVGDRMFYRRDETGKLQPLSADAYLNLKVFDGGFRGGRTRRSPGGGPPQGAA